MTCCCMYADFSAPALSLGESVFQFFEELKPEQQQQQQASDANYQSK